MTAKVTRKVAEEMGAVGAQAPTTPPSPEGLKAAVRLNKAVLFLHNMMLQSFSVLKQFRNTLPDDLNQHPAGEPLMNILTDIRRMQKPLTELHQRTQQLVQALNGQKTAARKVGSVDSPNEAMELAARVRKIAQIADAADSAFLAGNEDRAEKLMHLAEVSLVKTAADYGGGRPRPDSHKTMIGDQKMGPSGIEPIQRPLDGNEDAAQFYKKNQEVFNRVAAGQVGAFYDWFKKNFPREYESMGYKILLLHLATMKRMS